MRAAELAEKLRPFIMDWVAQARLSGTAGTFGAPSPHDLSGLHHSGTLTDDQGPQFLKADGSRALTGNLSVGAGITVDGVDISQLGSDYAAHITAANAHHNEMTLGTGGLTSKLGIATGQILTLAAINHSDLSSIDANQHVDHTLVSITAGNGLTGGGTIAATRTIAVGAGSGITVNADDVALSWGTPTISTIQPGDAASAGISENPARSDHKHAIAAAAPGTITPSATAAEGTSTSFARADHTHGATAGTPGTIQPDATASAGSATSFARSDHRHAIVAAAASTLTVASANGEGTSTSFARADHQHTITTSAAVSTATAVILATDASGRVQVRGLGVYTAATADDLRVGAALTFVGAQTIQTTTGNVTLAPAGDVIVNPTGKYVEALNNYDINLGRLTKKYLSLHAAELWVETLVAQDTLATIGGRILVGPTTTLIADVDAVQTTVDVKHNNLASGDRVVLEADSKLEWMAITSAATAITGGYRYSVTRNLDGTGANLWYAGDAIFNTGAAGSGFIDLYSLKGVTAGSTAGPAIVGNVRAGTTYSDYYPMWAIGNLGGLYGKSAGTYGAGFGRYGSTTSLVVDATGGIQFYDSGALLIGSLTGTQWVLGRTDQNRVTVDAANGVRFLDTSGNVQAQLTGAVWTIGRVGASLSNIQISSGAVNLRTNTTVNMSLSTAGVITIGAAATENVYITSTSVQMRDGTTVHTDLTGGVLTLGTTAQNRVSVDPTNGVRFWDSSGDPGNVIAQLTGTTWTIGRVAASNSNVQITSGSLYLRVNTTNRIGLTSAGVLTINDSGGAAVFTFNASAGAEFTKPLTLGTSGGIYQGTGTFASPTTGLKIWNDGGVGRIAGYASGAVQWYANTDGKLYAGGGTVVMDSTGLQALTASDYLDARSYKFHDGTNVIGGLYAYHLSSAHYVQLVSKYITGRDALIYIRSEAPAGNLAQVELRAVRGTDSNYFTLGPTTASIGSQLSVAGKATIGGDIEITRGGTTKAIWVLTDAYNDVGPSSNLTVSGTTASTVISRSVTVQAACVLYISARLNYQRSSGTGACDIKADISVNTTGLGAAWQRMQNLDGMVVLPMSAYYYASAAGTYTVYLKIQKNTTGMTALMAGNYSSLSVLVFQK